MGPAKRHPCPAIFRLLDEWIVPRQEVITAYPDALVSTTEDGDIAYLTFQKTAAQADEESLPVAYLGIGPIAYSEIKLDEASTTPPTEPAVPEAPEVRPGANAQAGASFDAVLGTSRYAIGDDIFDPDLGLTRPGSRARASSRGFECRRQRAGS
jgi:hypothetical protein